MSGIQMALLGGGGSSSSYVTRTSGVTTNLLFARYLNSQFVAPGANGTTIVTSSDGITWSLVSTVMPSSPLDMAYGAGLYVMVANDGIYTSSNLATWTLRLANSSIGVFVKSIARNSSVFAVGTSTSDIYTSPDGITWTLRSSAPGITLISRGMITDGTLLVNVAESNTKIQTSSDGITWTDRFTSSDTLGDSGAWTGTTFVIPGKTSSDTVVSTNGTTWTTAGGTGSENYSIVGTAAGANTKVLTLGDTAGSSYGSTDTGSTWTSYPLPAGASPAGVAYGAGLFVAVGGTGGVWTLSL